MGSVVDYKRDLDIFSAYYLILVLSAKTHIMNSGVNFFLYCLSGSKFRADLIILLGCSGKGDRFKKRGVVSGTTEGKSKSSFNETRISTISGTVGNDVITGQ